MSLAACALRARDEEKCVEVARYIMAKNQFSTDGYRVYAAICRLCSSTSGWYADSRVQKFTLRQIKMMDAALLPSGKKDKTLEDVDVKTYPGKELDATLLMMYGHILFVSNSFTYALSECGLHRTYQKLDKVQITDYSLLPPRLLYPSTRQRAR